MRILQLIYALSSGGAERFVVDMCNEMVAKGHEVFLVTQVDDTYPELQFNRQFLSPEVKVYNLGMARGSSLKGIPRMIKLLKKIKPDVVHGHLNVIPYMILPALFNRKIKYFHTIHNLAQRMVKPRQYRINKYLYSTCKINAVAISDICRQSYLDCYHDDHVTRIDNGRSPVVASTNLEAVRAQVESLKQSPDDKVFIHVARCNEVKNQQLLVEAFNALNAEGVKYTLIVVGDGFDSEYGKTITEPACNRIHFLGERPNVGDYLLCSDAFCLTSIDEGLPISLLEALSVGVTPICTRAGGIPDVITDGVTGYLSTATNLPAYKETLYRFLKNPLDGAIMKKFFADNYSMEICTRHYLQLFQDVITSKADKK